jgi:hypothetical protein
MTELGLFPFRLILSRRSQPFKEMRLRMKELIEQFYKREVFRFLL